jgi:hypothetical protein
MKISPPAFPTWIESDSMAHGMTLRDYFAAAALTGLLSDPRRMETPDGFADDAYMAADAMLKAREK